MHRVAFDIIAAIRCIRRVAQRTVEQCPPRLERVDRFSNAHSMEYGANPGPSRKRSRVLLARKSFFNDRRSSGLCSTRRTREVRARGLTSRTGRLRRTTHGSDFVRPYPMQHAVRGHVRVHWGAQAKGFLRRRRRDWPRSSRALRATVSSRRLGSRPSSTRGSSSPPRRVAGHHAARPCRVRALPCRNGARCTSWRRPERCADLYLACARLGGDPAAITAFHQKFRGDLERAVARTDPSPAFIDDVVQTLHEKLFFAGNAARPKIGEGGGRASLSGWLATVASDGPR